MAEQYWLQRDGKATGPFSGDQLKQMAAAGMIVEADRISADQMNWQMAGQVRGLFGETQATSRGSDNRTARAQESVTAEGNDVRPAPMGDVIHQQAHGTTSTEPADPTDRIVALGIASLCAGIVAACLSWVAPIGILLAITGLGLGGFVLYRIHVSGEGKTGLSIAGVSVSGVALLLVLGLAVGSPSPTGKRTKAAWEAMNDIDVTLSSLRKSQPGEFFKKNYMEYARIDTDEIDSELRDHIAQWIQVTRDGWELLQSAEREDTEIRKEVEEASRIGGALGSLDRDNPRGTSAGMALFMRGISSVAAREKLRALERKYEPRVKVLLRRMADLQKQRRRISSDLHMRYDRPFDIRLQ